MVESNHDEERLARVERMVEALQRQTAGLMVLTGKLTIWCDTHDMPTKKPKRPKREDAAQSAFRALQHVIDVTERQKAPATPQRTAPTAPSPQKRRR